MRSFTAIVPFTVAVCVSLILTFAASPAFADDANLTAPGAEMKKLADGFRFTEGPAVAFDGDVYFTDIPNNRILRWDVEANKLSVWMENTQGANGLYFRDATTLYACQGEAGRVARITVQEGGEPGEVTPVAETYNGKKFNKPNDLWIDRKGGVYFTDPNYGRRETNQDGEHVYYVSPDRKKITRVADDFQRPNGIIGTADGKKLYISDRSGGKTYVYDIKADGSIANKKLFCNEGSDGVTLDAKGNLYITPPASAVHVYSPAGKLIAKIATPKPPSNVTFGGKGLKTLYITARDGFYAIDMNVHGQTTTVMRR